MQKILDQFLLKRFFVTSKHMTWDKRSLCVHQGRGLSRFPGAARRESEIQTPTICFVPVNLKYNQRCAKFDLRFLCEIHYLWVPHQVVVDHWVNMWLEEWDWIPKISARYFLWIARCGPAYLLIFLANGRLSNFGKPPNRIFRGGTEHYTVLCVELIVLCFDVASLEEGFSGWF